MEVKEIIEVFKKHGIEVLKRIRRQPKPGHFDGRTLLPGETDK